MLVLPHVAGAQSREMSTQSGKAESGDALGGQDVSVISSGDVDANLTNVSSDVIAHTASVAASNTMSGVNEASSPDEGQGDKRTVVVAAAQLEDTTRPPPGDAVSGPVLGMPA